MDDIRLDKYITLALELSRKDAKALIRNKEITVNGEIIRDSDYKVQENDEIVYKGNVLSYEEDIYLMMNKPKGYVCSTDDELHKTVIDLINMKNRDRLMIVGRLDIDTTGLLLITNDGSFVHKLTSPSKKIDKKYFVRCDSDFTNDDVISFEKGAEIYLDQETPYICKSSKLEILSDPKEGYITIHEGKYHQVKKMCASVNKTVVELKRVQIGLLKLDERLAMGEYRTLTDEELELLR